MKLQRFSENNFYQVKTSHSQTGQNLPILSGFADSESKNRQRKKLSVS